MTPLGQDGWESSRGGGMEEGWGGFVIGSTAFLPMAFLSGLGFRAPWTLLRAVIALGPVRGGGWRGRLHRSLHPSGTLFERVVSGHSTVEMDEWSPLSIERLCSHRFA